MGTVASDPIVPTYHIQTEKVINFFDLTHHDIHYLNQHFQRILLQSRKEEGGIESCTCISYKAFYDDINEPRTRYSDCIFELLNTDEVLLVDKNEMESSTSKCCIQDTKSMKETTNLKMLKSHDNFKEGSDVTDNSSKPKSKMICFEKFVETIMTICFFEKKEFIEYCFYVFDTNKNGYIDKMELDDMLDMLHNIQKEDNGPLGYSSHSDKRQKDFKSAKSQLMKEVNDMAIGGKLELKEMLILQEKFPRLFYPIFRIQIKLMSTYFGLKWWERKKRILNLKRTKIQELNDKVFQTNILVERIRQRRIRRDMGLFMYYFAPWRRKLMDSIHPKKKIEAQSKKMTNDNLNEVKKKEIKEERKKIDRMVKNPVTQEYELYTKIRTRIDQREQTKDVSLSKSFTVEECEYLKFFVLFRLLDMQDVQK